ncbi:hypothetical protein GGTG_04961 [Gaeumannomyces tritici R3-111a-1]|uniref:Uncharacterized protein n=1 Tax=Gaeumannomyces tritici (strain R3-111a-1) TaxID=644352 RepID=J3NUK5_GAET3|nr:hypothetical protein GGTG_04961 [Gaeumannomyces tritici R3-111a-1]EJT79878.1 hypothetical protein GGTG_04961 [Gaeumannomyces tritici R3-111a-1]
MEGADSGWGLRIKTYGTLDSPISSLQLGLCLYSTHSLSHSSVAQGCTNLRHSAGNKNSTREEEEEEEEERREAAGRTATHTRSRG